MYDFCRIEEVPALNDEVDLIIQQIDILFDTHPGEVLGDISYGTNYSKYIHELNIGSEMIQSEIYSDIIENVELFGWDIEVEVKFMLGEQNDIIIVGIQFSKDSESYAKAYRIDKYREDYIEDVIIS